VKIICVGRNYAEPAADLGDDPPPAPLRFGKFENTPLTGPPPGVGWARDPKVSLKPGDVGEVEGIGVLSNPVTAHAAVASS
jgi:2-keto-4-pentenoate hydratase/2-oxohepta-3-ene-1,7-dioic acid hydratase in catechol pathway